MPFGAATLRRHLFITASTGKTTFFVTKKGSEKSPAVARQRTPPKGGTPPLEPQRRGSEEKILKNAGVLHFS